MSAEQIRNDLWEEWRNHSAFQLCLKLLDFIANLPISQAQMLTYGVLAQAVGKNLPDADLVKAINILSSSKVAALDTKALLIDDEHEYEVAVGEIYEAQITGVLIHPDTGDPIPDFESKLIPFFVPSAKFEHTN